MNTFPVVRDGVQYDIPADSQADAEAKADAHFGAKKVNKEQTFPVERDGVQYDIPALSQAEAEAKADAHFQKKKVDAEPMSFGEGVASHALAVTGGVLGGVLGIPIALADVIVQGAKALGIPLPTVNEGVENVKKFANDVLSKVGTHLPRETAGTRVIGDVTSALTGQGATKVLSDVVNKAAPLGQDLVQNTLKTLSAGQGVQAAGNVAGTTVTSVADELGGNALVDAGLGLAASVIISHNLNNWGDVKKAIANGEIKDADRQLLLEMGQKYPQLTQATFPLKSGLAKYLQRVSTSIPVVGTAGPVERQAEGVKNATQDLLDNTNIGTKQGAIDELVTNRGSRVSEMKGLKDAILNEASDPKIVKTSVERAARIFPQSPAPSKIAPSKEVGTFIGNVGEAAIDGAPDPTKYANRIEETLNVLPGSHGTKVKPALAQIDLLRARLEGANNPGVFGAYLKKLDDLEHAMMVSDPNGIELNRQWLRDGFKDPGLGTVGKVLDKMANSTYGAVAESLSDTVHSKLGPQVGNIWDKTNAKLASNMQDFKNSKFKTLINSGQANLEKADTFIDYIGTPNGEQAAKNMLKDLSPKGKADMADAIILRGMEKAGLKQDMDITAINPDSYIDELRKTYGPYGLFFSAEQTKQAKGLLEYMKAVKNSGSGDINWGNPIRAGAAVLTAPIAVTFMHAYNSPIVKNMLIRLHDMNPSSRQYQNLIQQLNDTIQKNAAQGDQNED